MRLYHFVKEKYGLLNLQHRRLKVARIADLNDPFEFFPACPDAKARRVINDFKRSAHEKVGLLCFSADRKNPVQWSHYADGHKGMCLGFDVPDSLVTKIDYAATRPMADMQCLFASEESGDAEIKRWLNIKYKHWEYENEWRVAKELKPEERHADGNWYAEFDPDIRLAEVLIGVRSRLTRFDLNNLLGDLAGSVDLWQTRLAFKTVYEVVLQMDRRRW